MLFITLRTRNGLHLNWNTLEGNSLNFIKILKKLDRPVDDIIEKPFL